MAFCSCNFYSEALGVSSTMSVIIPQKTISQIGMEGRVSESETPVLYLLHGLSDDHTIWMRRTSIERYAAALGLAVVMPAAGRSFYSDMKCGGRYWTFVSEELPLLARSFFNVSSSPKNTFVAGLSMGGYGAFKLALRNPGKYAAAASLSGVVDIESFVTRPGFEALRDEFGWIFGDLKSLAGSENDLFHLSRRLAEAKTPLPKLFQCCGTEDFLYQDNLKFKHHLSSLGVDFQYEESPGAHEWGYWDRMIQKVLAWLPLQGQPAS